MLANRRIALSVRLFLRSKKYAKSHGRQRIQLSEVGPQMLNAGQSCFQLGFQLGVWVVLRLQVSAMVRWLPFWFNYTAM